MKKIITSIIAFLYCIYTFALTESEGVVFVQDYYKLITEYATTAENISLAKKIENMHIGKGFVYPDVEIKLGGITETKGVGIKTEYLASILSRQNLLLKFVPKNTTLEGNNSGICTMSFTLYVYSGNEQPGREVLKYSVPLMMEIQNSDKKIRNILKSTKAASTLNVTPTDLTFGASGGTRTITVTSNTNWHISVNTNSWGHLSRSGNTLTLQVDAYQGTTDRTDYFKLKAGDKEEKITIRQTASGNTKPSAQIGDITVLQNQDINGQKGIIILVSFNIQNMKDKEGRVCAYFYDNDGNALIDLNEKYNTAKGKVAIGTNIRPKFDNTKYTDLQLKIPYSELHQSGTYKRTLKFKINIWNHSTCPFEAIYTSTSYTTFEFTPITEVTLTLDGSSSNKTKYFPESGGRKTYTVSTNASIYEIWGVPTWCKIENKTQSSFTLVCDPNPYSSDRSDYMKVKVSGKEIRIDIKQDRKSSSANITNSWLVHNLMKPTWNGFMWINIPYMAIHCHFDVSGHQGEYVNVCAFFYYPNGDAVRAINYNYRTPDGYATVQQKGKCTFENTEWKDFILEMPYPALPKGEMTVTIQIIDKNGNWLAESTPISFTIY